VLLTDPSPELVASTLPAERSAAWRALDVTIAHRVLIDRLWQLQDTEDVVGFEHDVPAAVAAAQRTGGVALLLNRRRSRRSPRWRRPASECRASRRCSPRSRGPAC
jgi:hypothetical protein